MKPSNLRAFSIIELVLVVSILGILTLVGFPGFRSVKDRTVATVTANDIKVFADALEIFSTETGSFPDVMTYTRMPDGVSSALPNVWKDGKYSWNYFNTSSYTLLYITDLRFTAEQAVLVDSMIDDGNIAGGAMRVGVNGTGLMYFLELESDSLLVGAI